MKQAVRGSPSLKSSRFFNGLLGFGRADGPPRAAPEAWTRPDGEIMDTVRHPLTPHTVFIVWKPEYNLGIPVIDEQHRGIVTTINSLYYALQHQLGENLLKPVIGMVNEYTRLHFAIEEDFQAKCGFPGAERHHGWHLELLNKLSRVGRKSQWDHDPHSFLEFLKEWWIVHICEQDRVFRDYLRDARLKPDGADSPPPRQAPG